MKSGSAAFVPVKRLAEESENPEIYVLLPMAFTPSRLPDFGVQRIEFDDLKAFMTERPNLLPPRIGRWLTGDASPAS